MMAAERTVEHLRRILVLVPWVIARGSPTVAEVCERFGMKPDELSADLDLLMLCGLPPFGPGDLIEASVVGDRVEIRMADYLAEPPRLTIPEAVALLVMGRAVAELPGIEHADSLTRALAKLDAALNADDAERARSLADRIEVELASSGAELVATLREAAAEHHRLGITYFSQRRGELTERTIDPLLVFSALGQWYVVADDDLSGEERTFRVDRIKEAALTGETFAPRAGFDPSRYGDAPVFVPRARDARAVVEIAPHAGWLREFIPAEHAVEGRGGWTRLEVRTSHLAWLIALLLSAGGSARALEPPELVTGVQQAARAALARYSD
jgi:proteasome accessory factor C